MSVFLVGPATKRLSENIHDRPASLQPLNNIFRIPDDFDTQKSDVNVEPSNAVKRPRRSSTTFSIKLEEERLKARAQALGLFIKKIAGNGACQFAAIADQLGGDPDAGKLRNLVCGFMAHHKAVFNVFHDNYDAYVDSMRKTDAWGDNFTLVAAATILGRDIKILMSTQGPIWMVIEPNSDLFSEPKKAPIWLAFTSERHYDSLYIASSPTQGSI